MFEKFLKWKGDVNDCGMRSIAQYITRKVSCAEGVKESCEAQRLLINNTDVKYIKADLLMRK